MFECNKCGLCCKSIANNPIYKDLDRGDGTCKYLSEDNLCSIYETRPLLCRVDEAYDKLFKNLISREDYYSENYKICDLLKKKNKEDK